MNEEKIRELVAQLEQVTGSGSDCVVLVSSQDEVKVFSSLSQPAVDGILHSHLGD
ncbi:hypothetical protein SAMN05443574_103308 [Haloarcula vallismortis]|uniref:Uncharacterized protein n=1 Tax=Haloarcula vallismortis TaxID=28442 RepID=A0A1H2TN66_HALVA|nr:hypothetical protein [Haloarcula vallismortis]SDW45217.1 hypothetical protein SAMN05443574_103308 [Haloarcula vallismortis]